MLRKGGNISSATSSLTNLPLTPFSSALSKVSFRKVLPWPSRHRGVWSAVRMRATGWPDNFADTWELQMLPRASSLLNVSVEAVRRPARFFSSSSLSFSSSPPPCVSSFFLPLPLSLFSFFFFFRPSRRHRGTFKLATVDEQRASVKLDYFFFLSCVVGKIFLEFFSVFSTHVSSYGYRCQVAAGNEQENLSKSTSVEVAIFV